MFGSGLSGLSLLCCPVLFVDGLLLAYGEADAGDCCLSVLLFFIFIVVFILVVFFVVFILVVVIVVVVFVFVSAASLKHCHFV